MAVNLPPLGKLLPVAGFRWGVAEANLRYTNRLDLAVLACDQKTITGGVYTQNRFKAAPVLVAEENDGYVRGLVVNVGSANAATGSRGLEDARASCRLVAQELGCDESEVLPFSTGVIGEFLPMDKVAAGIETALKDLSSDRWEHAARAIMTTDTQPKGYSNTFDLNGVAITTTGIFKGAGMIRPDMATMLAFQATDAAFTPEVAKRLAFDLAERSFNRLTVDGDTSTNDAFVVMGSGLASNEPIDDVDSDGYQFLLKGMLVVAEKMAELMVRDAEGASKFIEVIVEEGRTEAECLEVAYTIAHSPLVKTAFFASDPNWGRICMAIGRSGIEDLDQAAVSLFFDDVQIVGNGLMVDSYEEERAAEIMAKDEFRVIVRLGRGNAQAKVMTSDFSYDYVKINAEYRT